MKFPPDNTPHVLVVEDERTIRDGLCSALQEAGYSVAAASGVRTAREQLERSRVDAVLLDIRLKDGNGLELLAFLRSQNPDVPVIMATAYGDSERTIVAMKLGAFDYVTKPFDLDALLATLARAVHTPPAARVDQPDQQSSFVGTSPAMLAVWKAIGRAAASDVPVLITGESGVGKELVALAIHRHGERRNRPFVAVNLAALPASLIESELFGHEKGAFTGAHTRREGRFQLASDGTLFLDEIGDLDPMLQTKLLRVLEDGGFERVGGTSQLISRARIVAATSKPVAHGAQGATLRKDLYYRLGVVHIEVPPLRMRRQDIPLLVGAFLGRAPGPRRAVSEDAMSRLVADAWPGNVRQLRHVLESACVMSAAEVLDVAALQLPELGESATVAGESADCTGQDLNLRRQLEHLERQLIERALRIAEGNRAHAARLLGIRRAFLYARMKHFGLGE